MSITKTLETIKELLLEAPTQQEKLKLLIELGEDLEQTEQTAFSQEDKVPGCASDAYVSVEEENEMIIIKAYATSLIIKGYLAILQELFSGENKEDIINSEKNIQTFLEETKLSSVSTVPSRTNSFYRLYSFIQEKTKKI